MKILSIESSCDETAVAIVEDGHKVYADVVASQVEIHAKWGGVVPELASRNHLVHIIPVVKQALKDAQCSWQDIDAIAVTQGPGLVGALLVGLQVAKSLAMVYRKPLIAVNHLLGHLNAIHLHGLQEAQPAPVSYPHLALVVSGGHTALYKVIDPCRVEHISNTRDDAAGEAFDKVARMLGLGYPGGPVVEKGAQGGDENQYAFTLARFKNSRLDFSFSGLKTAVLTKIKKHGCLPQDQDRRNLLASFQKAVVQQLVDRSLIALKQEQVEAMTLAGGVACNQLLRDTLQTTLAKQGKVLHVPPKKWCTDNAAMIASAAYYLYQQSHSSSSSNNLSEQIVTDNSFHGLSPHSLMLNARSSWPVEQQ